MFYYDRGLFLHGCHLALDVCRSQPCGFISHAHSDHIGKHKLALCTRSTAVLCRHRLGDLPIKHLEFGEVVAWSELQLTALPAGHVLGSAMLLVEDQRQSLLYTGDFRLGPSATAEPAELPQADVLVMETTFGDANYRLPPRELVIEQLLERVRQVLRQGRTPVVHAYVLGKAQEVTRILTAAGIPVQQHAEVHAISQLYEECGCELGEYRLYNGQPLEGHVLVMPPRSRRGATPHEVARPVTFAVTGWAASARTRHWHRADFAFPLSDHADYDQLIEAVERVAPREVYCTHGPASFVDDLRARGWQAQRLEKAGRSTAASA